MPTPPGASRIGTRFGPYELRSLIGVGGMGEVYRAYDTVKDRTVAVKVLRTEVAADPSYQARFRRESRVAARLQEPHVIPVHDFGDIDGVLFIDMRLVEGGSIKDLLRAHGPLDPVRAAAIITQVASALDAAHADGLVHRDIKPENVLLTANDFAYLVDFGIAYGGGEASVTMTGVLIGSSAYMAPERFGGGPVGPPADIYALTCLLYECLTGRPPFETGDLRQLMSAHMFTPPPRPSIMRRGITRAFDEVIARGMAKEAAARYPTAGDLARAATQAAADFRPVPPAPAPDPIPPRPQTREFSAVYPNPEGTGYTPYPPQLPPPAPAAAVPAAAPPARKQRFRRSHVTLVVATAVLLGVAAVLAAILVSGDDTSGSTRRTPLAAPPEQDNTTTETTTPTTTTTKAGPLDVSGTDAQGFVGHTARCDSGSTPAAMIRTAQSIAVICQTGSNSFYYRGERLRDGANLEISTAERAGGGFDATNPADGALYQIRPDSLTIISNGHVDSAESALEFDAR
ncbi:serine/threonine-protein kinase [Mycolicibacterium mageritense]|uniref:serine/threonine-protein kinase n=1 Tax=Mycolicibacterium mageritense TaxID=53462 RepID=UPI001E4233C4|nr:serine/threonine-protein kinase [Mycolicibacterium mageritense]GJJ16361.1 protein kinase [Mycolicibacterium mageritense]